MTIQAWKLLAILATSACAALTAAVIWVALAYGSNLREITEGAQVCLVGARSYDSVAAAQMIGRLDLVSFLLTVGGLLLAVFALMGFWMIRREALDEASRVAADEARKVAQKFYSGQNENRTTGRDKPDNSSYSSDGTPFPITGVSTAGAVEETGEGE